MRDGAAARRTPLRRDTLGRFLMYALVGAAGTAGHYALLIGAVSVGLLAPVPASMLGAVVGALINFVLNTLVTFRGRLAWPVAARFFATAGLAALLNGAAMALLVDRLGLDYRPAQLIVTAGLLCSTFFINSIWTFRANRTR